MTCTFVHSLGFFKRLEVWASMHEHHYETMERELQRKKNSNVGKFFAFLVLSFSLRVSATNRRYLYLRPSITLLVYFPTCTLLSLIFYTISHCLSSSLVSLTLLILCSSVHSLISFCYAYSVIIILLMNITHMKVSI